MTDKDEPEPGGPRPDGLGAKFNEQQESADSISDEGIYPSPLDGLNLIDPGFEETCDYQTYEISKPKHKKLRIPTDDEISLFSEMPSVPFGDFDSSIESLYDAYVDFFKRISLPEGLPNKIDVVLSDNLHLKLLQWHQFRMKRDYIQNKTSKEDFDALNPETCWAYIDDELYFPLNMGYGNGNKQLVRRYGNSFCFPNKYCEKSYMCVIYNPFDASINGAEKIEYNMGRLSDEKALDKH